MPRPRVRVTLRLAHDSGARVAEPVLAAGVRTGGDRSPVQLAPVEGEPSGSRRSRGLDRDERLAAALRRPRAALRPVPAVAELADVVLRELRPAGGAGVLREGGDVPDLERGRSEGGLAGREVHAARADRRQGYGEVRTTCFGNIGLDDPYCAWRLR